MEGIEVEAIHLVIDNFLSMGKAEFLGETRQDDKPAELTPLNLQNQNIVETS